VTKASIAERVSVGPQLLGRIGMSTTSERVVLGFLGLLTIVVVWHIFSLSGVVDPLAFPSPSRTAEALADLFMSGEIYPHIIASGVLFTVGLVVSIVAGIVVGFVAGWSPTIRALLSPHVAVFYSVPSIALMPLFIVWLGFGFASQFLVVFLFAFFPPFYAAMESVATADRNLVRMSKSFGASDARLFRAIILPGSIPILLVGMRIAVGKAIAAVITAELYASVAGLGFLLNEYGIQYRTSRVFAIVVILAIVGLTTSLLLRWAESRFDVWRPSRMNEV
jgi:NitT/TauT family transport system permease protein